MENEELKKAVEALLFITDQPISVSRIQSILGVREAEQISASIDALQKEYEERGCAIQVLEIAEGFQMSSRPAHAAFIRKLYAERMTMRLSAAALETLSIVAYKQPLTRAEIEEIRGVEVIAALETLLDKRLIKVMGRKESVGRPLLYGTTPDFMRHFGLKSIEDMPPIDSFQLPTPMDAPAAAAPEAGDPSASVSAPSQDISSQSAATSTVVEGKPEPEISAPPAESGSEPSN